VANCGLERTQEGLNKVIERVAGAPGAPGLPGEALGLVRIGGECEPESLLDVFQHDDGSLTVGGAGKLPNAHQHHSHIRGGLHGLAQRPDSGSGADPAWAAAGSPFKAGMSSATVTSSNPAMTFWCSTRIVSMMAQTERRGVGRPTFVYSLTEKAEKLFPQAYAPMALAFLRLLRRTQGESAVDRFFSLRARDLASAYRRRLQGLSAPQKLQELARIREEEGYMASSGAESLTEHHCPISAIAAEFPQACRVEHRLFEQVLGRRLRRVEHIASGDRACVYRHAARSDGS